MSSADPVNGEPKGGFEPLNQVTSTPSEEAAPPTEDSSTPAEPVKDGPDNWWDTNGMDEKVAGRIKSIQTEFQRKSERAKEAETARIQLQQQMNQIVAEARAVLNDPEQYRRIRRQMGYDTETINAPKPEEFKVDFTGVQTVQDLEKNLAQAITKRDEMWRSQIANEVNKVKSELEARIGAVAEPVAKTKWESAIKSVKEKYGPSFAAREAEVVEKIVNGPYRALYGQLDEQTILDKVFIAEFPDDAFKAMSEKQAATKAQKAASTTAKPSKKGGTTTPSGNTKDDIIARVNARCGSK